MINYNTIIGDYSIDPDLIIYALLNSGIKDLKIKGFKKKSVNQNMNILINEGSEFNDIYETRIC